MGKHTHYYFTFYCMNHSASDLGTVGKKMGAGLIALSLLLVTADSSFAMYQNGGKKSPQERPENMQDMTEEERDAQFEERIKDLSEDEQEERREEYEEMKAIHQAIEALEKPENFDELSPEERKEFLEDNGIDTDKMEEMRETRTENREEMKSENKGADNKRQDRQTNMQNMTEEERAAQFEERTKDMSEDEKAELLEKHEEMKSESKENRNLLKNAKKAKYFKKNMWTTLEDKKEFLDEVKMEHPEAIEFLQRRGILKGYSDGSFQPNKEINRAESIKVLLESLGEEPSSGELGRDFSDVKATDWFAGYVTKAKERNIITGYSDGTFQPSKTVNQAELLKVAFEAFGIDLSEYEVTSLPSEVATDAWFAVYFQYALDNDLLDEEDVNPSEGMTRDGFSSVVSRLIQQQEAL